MQQPSSSYSWYSGYSAHNGATYFDYGSADQCSTTGVTGRCGTTSWYQTDYYNLAWGYALAWPTPEIYNTSWASQWYYISQAGGGGMQPYGPLADPSVNGVSATSAWAALNSYFPNMSYLLQMETCSPSSCP